jgi:hypothetical protein
MVYTISSLYGIGCAYRYEWEDPLEKCTGGSQWPILFVLSALPALIRLVQCIKRYNDSGVVHHLVNVGSDVLALWSERLIQRYREENIPLVLYITSYIHTGGPEVRTPSR